MARIRSIKPEFFTSLTVADLPLSARLTFIGLWTYVDDNGVGLDEPRLVRAAVWPLDDRTAADVEADLEALRSAGLILRYEAGGRRLLAVKNWEEHQKVSHPRKPRFPMPQQAVPSDGTPPDQPTPPTPEDSGNPQETLQSPPETLRPEQGSGNREQGAGKEGVRAGARTREASPWSRTDEAVGERMVSEWWDRYGRATAQARSSVLAAVEQALRNGLDPGELWQALIRLGDTSKPVSGGTLQFALSAVRSTPHGAAGGNVVPLRGSSPPGGRDLFAEHVALYEKLAAEEAGGAP
ncbi:hypothetical protein [Streptomyces sp. UG1]|uniref:hypothetical protein n=1 Tax=Streptomyces sp. UG1 TaxID=3417652 RepID=UPI003CEF1FD4